MAGKMKTYTHDEVFTSPKLDTAVVGETGAVALNHVNRYPLGASVKWFFIR